jgi:hypothetical protein
MINLNMLGPLSEMMLRGSRELRFFCADIYLNIWERDHTLFTADLQTLQLLGSFIPDNPTDRYFDMSLFVECVSWMVENVSDYQLLIDSNLLKDLLRLIDNSDVVIEFFSQLLLDFISDEKKCFLQFLVDDIGALSSLINIMHRLTWEDVLEMDSYIRVIDSAKFAVRAVMKSEERYKEMVSQMEIPGSLKTELMNGM